MKYVTATPQVLPAATPEARRAVVGQETRVMKWTRQARAVRRVPPAVRWQVRQAVVVRRVRQAVVARPGQVKAVRAAQPAAKACVRVRWFAPVVPARIVSARVKVQPSFALTSSKRCSNVPSRSPTMISSAWVAIRFPMTTSASRKAQRMPVVASAFDREARRSNWMHDSESRYASISGTPGLRPERGRFGWASHPVTSPDPRGNVQRHGGLLRALGANQLRGGIPLKAQRG